MDLFDAIIMAVKAHHGQVRKFTGEPYIVHPLRVAQRVADRGYSRSAQIAAVLHDVVEDTSITLTDLAEAGADDYVLRTVALLTHNEAISYDEYIARLLASRNPGAMAIKLADLDDNLSDLPPEHRLNDRYTGTRGRILRQMEGTK